MHKLFLPAQKYNYNELTKSFEFPKEDGIIGLFELLWTGVHLSPVKDLTTVDHKVVKKLKKKLRNISTYKDIAQDSRIVHDTQTELWLEGDEFLMLKRLLQANNFIAAISDEVSTLWDCIDSATEQELKPSLAP